MVLEKITDIISEQLEIDKSVIKETSSFTDDLGAGSLDMIDLAMSIEDEFGFELPDTDLDKIKTVGQLAEFIEKNMK
ncbi:MAG: acyl carrier protein [Clostridia bacterium]|nr:acyl carrier protein [Clostridia bacterium]MBQ6468017.1 acyl carrier protein [Clostridia bacterium]MBR5773102.1 acyl carrier protein [Clostridia bacterium]